MKKMLRKAWAAADFILQRFPFTLGVLLGWAIIYSTASVLDWFLPQSFTDVPHIASTYDDFCR